MSSAAAQQAWVVLKFGGTSVSSRERWETIGALARERKQNKEKPFVVCSAVSQISNMLEKVVRGAGEQTREDVVRAIVARHHTLAEELQVDADAVLGDYFEGLERLARGADLLGEVSPRAHAKILAHGELMSTRLGAAFLESQGMKVLWLDARTALRALRDPNASESQRYLSTACDYAMDNALRERIEAEDYDIVLTQGFIARDAHDDTVLLGRGGSDTSAAYFAAKIEARRCEIWTDVPGMFTADPRVVPLARHILLTDYDEAQEIATTGSKVLHPRCIGPCREHEIPIEIHSTPNRELPCTRISGRSQKLTPGVKALSAKKNITLVSMDSLGMWQQAGFLGDVFGVFKRHGLSVDQVSTSETNVTVTLDPTANTLTAATIESLLQSLESFCKARVIEGCAAVSLVGTGIRSILHRLGPALAFFDEPQVYMVTQSASDLNLTFIVDEDHATRLVQSIHGLLFDDIRPGLIFGRTWAAIQNEETPAAQQAPWWVSAREDLLQVDVSEGPVYVYDGASIQNAARSLRAMTSVDRVFYAMKANSHPGILKLLAAEGLGFECVSPGELDRVFETLPSLDPSRVLFTPNFAPIQEYADAFARGVHVNLDNLYPLQQHPQVFAGKEVIVRIDPGQGRGHHDHVRTGGRGSKFGIDAEDLDTLISLTEAHNVRVVGLHVHAGSGILTSEHWRDVATVLLRHAERFPDLKFLDLGGGLGVVERPDQEPLDLSQVDASLQAIRDARPDLELWLEPGRYLVAQAGVLLSKVTQLKGKGEMRYVGVSAGMHSLLRPTLYGAHHHIVNLSKFDAPRTIRARVVGPICESGDTLGVGRHMPEPDEGDMILIATAGAYGYTMASNYNLRGLPREVLR